MEYYVASGGGKWINLVYLNSEKYKKNGKYKKAYANKNSYQKKYNHSVKKNEDFWRKEGKRITWIKPYKKIKDIKYSKTDVKIKWFYDGKLNASVNCIDRHLKNSNST